MSHEPTRISLIGIPAMIHGSHKHLGITSLIFQNPSNTMSRRCLNEPLTTCERILKMYLEDFCDFMIHIDSIYCIPIYIYIYIYIYIIYIYTYILYIYTYIYILSSGFHITCWGLLISFGLSTSIRTLQVLLNFRLALASQCINEAKKRPSDVKCRGFGVGSFGRRFLGKKHRKVPRWGPTWRIIPVSKWLVTPMYKPLRPFIATPTLLRGLVIKEVINLNK